MTELTTLHAREAMGGRRPGPIPRQAGYWPGTRGSAADGRKTHAASTLYRTALRYGIEAL